MTDFEAALAALRAGEIIGLPTDTVYGLAVGPFDGDAVGRLFALKGRGADKPLPVLGASVADLAAVGSVGELPGQVLDAWPGGLTAVVPRNSRLAAGVGDAAAGTVAIRVPDHPAALAVLAATGPLAVTSANRSGHPEAVDAAGAEVLFGDAVAHYVPGAAEHGEASTIVDLTATPPVVLRSGPVAWEPE